jgi:hypothetical protein
VAKVKFSSRKAAKNLIKQIDKVTGSNAVRNLIGEFLVSRVQLQVRRGKPLNDTGDFPKLEKSTIARRKKLAELNPVDRAFRGGKSNLTFTGQLVDAIAFRRKSKSLFELFVRASPRFPYIGLKGQPVRAPNNRKVDTDLRSGVGKKKKQFVMFTADGLRKNDKILERIRNIYVRFLRKKLRKT